MKHKILYVSLPNGKRLKIGIFQTRGVSLRKNFNQEMKKVRDTGNWLLGVTGDPFTNPSFSATK